MFFLYLILTCHLSRIQTYQLSRIQTYQLSRIQTCQLSRIQTCQLSRIQTRQLSRIQTYQLSRIQTCQLSHGRTVAVGIKGSELYAVGYVTVLRFEQTVEQFQFIISLLLLRYAIVTHIYIIIAWL